MLCALTWNDTDFVYIWQDVRYSASLNAEVPVTCVFGIEGSN